MRNYLFFLLFLPLPFLSFFRPWIGMLIWGWLALLNPHRDLWGAASTAPYNQIIAIATIAGWLLSNERKLPRFDLTLCLILGFFALATISAFNSLAPDLTWPKWNEFGKTVIYVVLLSAFLTTRARIHAFVWLMVGCIGFFGLKGGALFVVSGGSHHFSGPQGSAIDDRNALAVAILMAVPLMDYLRQISANLWARWGLIFTMILSVIAVIATYSRGGLIALLAGGAFLWWHSANKLKYLTAAIVLAVGLYHIVPREWAERMETINTADKHDESFQGRVIAWHTYWEASLDRPLVGAGMYALNRDDLFLHYMSYGSGLDSAKAAHSIYFQIAGELGLLAFIVFMLLLAATFICNQVTLTARTSTDSWPALSRSCQCSLVVFATGGAALSIAYYDLYFMLIILTSSISKLASQQAQDRGHTGVLRWKDPQERPRDSAISRALARKIREKAVRTI